MKIPKLETLLPVLCVFLPLEVIVVIIGNVNNYACKYLK